MPLDPRAQARLRRLEAITDAALGHLELERLLHTMLERVRELFGIETATVLAYDHEARQLTAIAATGIEEEVFQGVRVPLGAGFAGRVAASREPVVVNRGDGSPVVNALLWERGLVSLLGVPMLAGDELVGVLHIGSTVARVFGPDDIDLLRLAASRLALAMRVEVASEDRAAASALQRSLLPARLPEVPGLEFAARYVPGSGTAVGGDWYDLFPLPGDRLGVVMGDVAGHGLGAAVVMGRLRSALRAYALESGSPAEVLGKLSRKANHFEHGVMATIAYGIVEPGRDRLVLSLAGHPPPVLAVPGRPAELVDVPPDVPVGLGLSTSGRRDTVVELPPGSLLVLYTDGLVERRGEDLDDGLRRLVGAVTTGAPESACARVMAALIGATAAEDDVALLAVSRTPADTP
ncbi:SpoIIE family protein phosphatase [Amycolatopsis sp. NBC_00345]|uniref:PP2C family protein-serine/threonine phosphatase n=1 Tax=Amycolatopsis sp. NBC_00345 TaxID=2975955 RepID=UPI002E2525E4